MYFWQNRKVLITGASGFIGSHLVKKLVEKDANIITLSKTKNLLKSQIIPQSLIKKITSQQIGKIEDFKLQNKIIKNYNIDTIFHLAAQPIVEIGKSTPINTFEVNIKGTWNILEAARQNNVDKIIIASTVHVYGDNPNLPYREEYFPKPSRPYETSKACADLLAQAYADSYNLPVEIPRFVNIYGPGDLNFSRLIPKTMKAILKGEQLKIWDIGSVRDFLYVDDAIEAYLMLVEKELPNKKRIRVLNFGTGNPVKILDLVKKIFRLTKKEIEVEIESTPNVRINEIPKQYVSIDKAKNLLGWYPQTSLEEGLIKTFEWYKRNVKSFL